MIYDIGCSLAETAIRLSTALPDDCHIVGVDASPYMVAAARDRIAAAGLTERIDVRLGSASEDLPAETSSVVILSLTLQFIRPVERERVVENVMKSLQPGGALLLFEKTIAPTPLINRLFIDEYHEHKSDMGYTADEIWRKRLSLENVLIPYTIAENIKILRSAGFSEVQTAFQWMNFSAFLAVK
jgi:tRNA (cmo5U34)-methyltransferase